MLGDFLTRGLVLVLGYAYPAFECFKTVEKNKVNIEELRFWCQYWIIVAALAVFERIGDIFISWLPMYGEAKIAFFIYLWYPKTKGTLTVYESLVRPYVAKHETDIDRKLQELKARAWDLFVYHLQSCTKLGQHTFFQFMQFMAAQSAKMSTTTTTNTTTEKPPVSDQNQYNSSAAQPPSPTGSPSFHNAANRQRSAAERRRPPLPPSATASAGLMSPRSIASKIHLRSQTAFIHDRDDTEPEVGNGSQSLEESDANVDLRLQAARLKLRRNKGFR